MAESEGGFDVVVVGERWGECGKVLLGRFQCCDKVVASNAFVPIGKAPLGMNEVGPWCPITGTAREAADCATVRWRLACLVR